MPTVKYSVSAYIADGTTTDYLITWDYLDDDHITVEVDGISNADPTASHTFTKLNDTTVRVTDGIGGAIAAGKEIQIRRNTPITTRPISFADGSALLAADLNKNSDYLLYSMQEALDQVDFTVQFQQEAEAFRDETEALRDAAQSLRNLADSDAAEADAHRIAAALSETNASASEVAAAASEAAAATSEANSAVSEAALQAAQDNAEASATAAAASETAAAASESASAISEANAAGSEAGVAADAATATSKAAAASVSESNALIYKDNAAASASNSEISAVNSANSATASANSAVQAATSENAAATSRNTAGTYATNSQASAVASEVSRVAAASSETAAASSEANAATSETNAAASEASALTSKEAAEAALDNFDDRYLGAKAADPTTDNDGDPLLTGALYFNTTDEVMKVYEGAVWVAAYASLSGALLASSNLSDVANTAASRQNLGLVIGTDVQAFSAILENTTATYTTAEENKLAGIEENAKDDQTITAGSGLTGGGSGDVTISHDNTSSQGSVNNSGPTVIQDVTLDTYGHVTGLTSKALTLEDLGGSAEADRVQIFASEPAVGPEGSVYYNTTVGLLYFSNGTSWSSIGNKGPQLTQASLQLDQNLGGAISLDFSQYFYDEEGTIESYTTSGALPSGTSISGSTLTGSFTQVGSGSFTVTAADNEGLTSQAFTVNYNITEAKIVAQGGSETSDGVYRSHVFTGSGTLQVSESGPARILIVAGGGSGGAGHSAGAGGGGAGGLVYGEAVYLAAGSYTVSVGAGGPQTPVGVGQREGNQGSDSGIVGVATAYGGGAGGGCFNNTEVDEGRSGGSSGGNGHASDVQRPPTRGMIAADYASAMTAYGNVGGTCTSWDNGSGGGGGAGAAGTGGPSGSGGDGLEFDISGSFQYYAGGGGGGKEGPSPQGGAGGGGQGYRDGNGSGTTAGQANTGGGGGAGGKNEIGGELNTGGSGIVIIRYEI